MLGINAKPVNLMLSTVDMLQQEEADFEIEDDCKIPLIVFWPPNHAEVNKIFQVKDKTVVQGREGGREVTILFFT